jgi:hypothetical protein
MAEGFGRTAGKGTGGPADLSCAAVVLVVKALVDAELRKQQPERTFPGATDVADLAAAVVGLFGRPAAELNGRRLLLAPRQPSKGDPSAVRPSVHRLKV